MQQGDRVNFIRDDKEWIHKSRWKQEEAESCKARCSEKLFSSSDLPDRVREKGDLTVREEMFLVW